MFSLTILVAKYKIWSDTFFSQKIIENLKYLAKGAREMKQIIIRRLPIEVVAILKSKGGVHKSKKGRGSYVRKTGKKVADD